ncbi:MAG: glycosyltransferase family 39 protein [Anaerolineae bacterium]|nr:glycosyltransferase family 39 protein [Anaerolineae bacterium]
MNRSRLLPTGIAFLLIAAFMAAGALYARATLPFESPDETWHMAIVRYIRRYRALPPMVVSARIETASDLAGFYGYHEPPLYYAPPLYYSLAALLAAPFSPMEDLPDLIVPSPCWERGWGLVPGTSPENKNFFAHRFGEEASSSTVRVLYVLRGLSLLLGVATLLALWRAARLLWPERPWLCVGALAIAALTPQFIATSSGVTNDSLTNLLFALAFAAGIAARRSGSGRGWLALGGLAGLAMLTKQSGLMLLPLGMLMAAWREGNWRLRLRDALLFLGAALATGGWWYGRNAVLYGEPSGLATHLVHVRLPRFPNVVAVLDSFYAQFGWGVIRVHGAVYWAERFIVLGGGVGLLNSLRRGGSFWAMNEHKRQGLAILAVALVLNCTLLVPWILATGPSLGRLLYPSLLPVACLLAWGWAQWARWRAGRGLCVLLAAAGLGFVFVVPFRYLQPAFRSPLLRAVPEQTHGIVVEFEHGISLVGYAVKPEIGACLGPGDRIHVSLYWRADRVPVKDYFTWVQLGPDGGFPPLSKAHTFAGGTLYPTSLWRPGDIVRQDVVLAVPERPEVIGRMWVRAGFVDGDRRVTAIHSSEGAWDGNQQAARLGPFYVVDSTQH